MLKKGRVVAEVFSGAQKCKVKMKFINDNNEGIWVLQSDLGWKFSTEKEIELPKIILHGTSEFLASEIEDIRETAPIKSGFITGLLSGSKFLCDVISIDNDVVSVIFSLLVFTRTVAEKQLHLKDLVFHKMEIAKNDPILRMTERAKKDIQNQCDEELFGEIRGKN